MKKIILAISVLVCLTGAGRAEQARLPDGQAAKWENINNGIDEIDLRTVAVNPNNPDLVYAGSSRSIFKSADGGKTWQKAYMVRGTDTAVNAICFDPRNADIVYAGTQNGLYKSADNGASWKDVFAGLSQREKDVRHILVQNSDPNKIYATTGNGLFYSGGSGGMWNRLPNILARQTINFIAQDPVDPNIVYAAANTGIFKSLDGGSTFERVFMVTAQTDETDSEETSQDSNTDENATYSNKMPICIAIDTLNKEKIYAGTNNGVLISSDSGKSWTALTRIGLTNRRITALISMSDSSLYAATKGGVFKIGRDFGKWEELYDGLTSKDIRYLAWADSGKTLFCATSRGLFKMRVNDSADSSTAQNAFSADKETQKLLAKFNAEPGIQQIQETAVKYAEVHKEKITEWRKSAKRKAMLPKVSVGIDESEGDYYYGGTWKGREGDTGWDLSLTWDLGELIWNNDQTNIDVRSRLLVQLRDDILNEVTKLYFERRRLQIELLTNPPANLQHRLDKELRLQELTAGVDALTGGWFSKSLKTAAD